MYVQWTLLRFRLVIGPVHSYDRHALAAILSRSERATRSVRDVLYENTSGLAAMVSPCVRWLALGVSVSATMLWIAASQVNAQQPTPSGPAGSSGPTNSVTQPSSPGATPKKSASWKDRLTDSLFLRLDKNHDKSIDETELKSTDAAPYRDDLKAADRDGNGRITQEEFRRRGEVPFYRDLRSVAAILLLLGFACFCMFLDGLLEPDRRDYFLLTIGGSVVSAGLAYLFAQNWFFDGKPYLGFVAAVPVLLIVLAVLTGATKEKEEPTGPTGPIVYKVGAKPTAEVTPGQKPSQRVAPRKPTAPVRTPRPAPLPRPPVPERRPQTPPRTQPPRPPGPSAPGSGPKPPPGKK